MIITRKKIKVESSYHGHVHGSENFRRHNTVDNWCTANEKRETIKNPWLWVLVGKILIWIIHSVIIRAIQWRRKENISWWENKTRRAGLDLLLLMTSYLVSITTDHYWSWLRMCARDERTATENVRCWCFILREKNSEKPCSPPLLRPRVKRLFDIFNGISPTASAAKFTFWLEKLNRRKTGQNFNSWTYEMAKRLIHLN